MADLQQLADETAEAILTAIKNQAPMTTDPSGLQALAEAYAVTVSAGAEVFEMADEDDD